MDILKNVLTGFVCILKVSGTKTIKIICYQQKNN